MINIIPKIGSGNEKKRQVWIADELKKIPKGSKILDAGAGEQQYRKYCNHLKYVSQDFAQYNPKTLKIGIQRENWDYGKLDIISDISSIPRSDRSFNAILCAEVFEHIINPELAIKEFSRLLKKSGKLILTAPFCSATHFAPYHYSSGFNKFYYEEILPKYGFKILKIKSNGSYFEYLAQETKRLPEMSVKYSSRKLSLWAKFVTVLMIRLIANYAKTDSKSSEFLCYGYHIIAIKI